MKKILNILRRLVYSFKSLYLLLLIPIICQSCYMLAELEPSPEVQASLDAYKQQFSGPSYDESKLTKSAVGFNIGVIFATTPGGTTKKSSGGHTFNNKEFGRDGNFYASISNDPSILYNNSQNGSLETSGTTVENSGSGFMTHVYYTGGLEFIQKSSKEEGVKINLNYLEIPLYAMYQIYPTSTGNFFGGVGPYFAYGIGGKTKSSAAGQTFESKSFEKPNGFKPFDAGIGLTVGYKMIDSFSLSLAYEFGLTNLERNAGDDKAKNRGISLNVRYPLNKIIK